MKFLTTATPVLLVFLLVATGTAFGQCRLPIPPFGVSGLGAIDRGRAIVTDYEAGLPPHVHFFEKTTQGWQQEDTFVVGDKQVFFPLPVAMDGDRAIVGSPESNGLNGRVFVFDRVGDRWVQTELVSATAGSADFFGSSVAIDGDVAVIGAAHFGQGGGNGLARMHVFQFDGTAWVEVTQILPYSEEIDVDGDTIVLGVGLSYPGYVYVYRKVAGLWTWTNQLHGPYNPGGAYFGSSVALQGDTLAVGVAGGSGPVPGSVEVFQLGSLWLAPQHIVPTNSAPADRFGSSVALSGTTLLVGATEGGAPGRGKVHRFEHDGTSFVEAGSFGPEDGVDGFGDHVAFQREDAILSSYGTVSFYRLGFAHQSSFCPTTPNSTGSPGSLSVEGCDSLDGQRFTLVASGLPAGVLGVCFFGANTTQVPFGDGFRCVGEPFFRLPSGTADAAGRLIHDVDFSSSPASTITAGRTWHFQAYHRDPASAGAGLNLTNALSIGITP